MLRFTIRDVLWLTLVVGLAVGWWVDRGKRIEQQAETALQLKQATLQLRQSLNQQALLRSIVIELAGAMRDDGWMVSITPNGAGGYTLSPMQNWESREEVAFKFNQANPLPSD